MLPPLKKHQYKINNNKTSTLLFQIRARGTCSSSRLVRKQRLKSLIIHESVYQSVLSMSSKGSQTPNQAIRWYLYPLWINNLHFFPFSILFGMLAWFTGSWCFPGKIRLRTYVSFQSGYLPTLCHVCREQKSITSTVKPRCVFSNHGNWISLHGGMSL